ncbi:MAG: polysaccharide deacetylase family protein, partial [Acidobacteriota bacterium]
MLTFDGGSTTEGALDILDALRSKGIRTTFFLTGVFIRKNPALVRRLVADGHEIGNHTDTHRHLTLWASLHQQVTRPEVDRLWLHNELHRAAAAFRAVTGGDMSPLWRAPYGEYNTQILRWAQEEGWTHVGWTGRLDSLDWVSDKHSRIYHSADQIAARLLAFPDV